MQKTLLSLSLFVLLMLTLTQLAAADFTVVNDSNERLKVIYSYFDPSEDAFWIKGYYHINPGNSKRLKVPENVDQVVARIWTASEAVVHDRPTYWTWAVHPRRAFEVVYKHKERIVLQSNVPREELVAFDDFYAYANNTTFTYQPGNGSVNIPDRYLSDAIEKALGKVIGARITPADMLKLQNLDDKTAGDIHILTGLEFATNLRVLSLRDNNISDVSPLRNLTNLTDLNVGDNDISDVSPLRNLTNLTWLSLYDNNISDVSPLRNLTNLTWLSLSVNNISDVSPLRNLTNLTQLYLWSNNIPDVSPLRNLTKLTVLVIRDNAIADFSPIARLIPNLDRYENANQDVPIDDDDAMVEDVPEGDGGDAMDGDQDMPAEDDAMVEDVPEDDGGDADDGFAVDVDPSVFVNIPDPNLRAAIEKKLGKASGARITPAEMLKLTEFEKRHAGIRDLTGLEFATNLTELDLGNNDISDVSPLRNLTKLTGLDLVGNEISDVSPLRNLTKLTGLQLDVNNISDVSPLRNLTKLTVLTLWSNNISDVSALGNLTKLTGLDLGNNDISDISALGNLRNLTHLNLDDNDISDVSPLRNLTKLTRLDIDDNDISDVSTLGNLRNLTGLYISGNNISDVSPLRNLTKLRALVIRNNEISDFSPIAGLIPNLVRYDNADQDVDLSVFVNIPDPVLRSGIEEELGKTKGAAITRADMLTLTGFSPIDHGIENLTGLEFATNLTSLKLRSHNLSDISPLANLTNITSLDLENNNISDISPLANLTNITSLMLGDNNISDVSPLTKLTNLISLYLSGNRISDVSPLAKLTNLISLYLSDNNISDVSPLAKLTKLTHFNIKGNNISDVSPLRNLTNLTVLYLDDNAIADFSPIARLIPNLDRYENANQDVDPNDSANIPGTAYRAAAEQHWIHAHLNSGSDPIKSVAFASDAIIYFTRDDYLWRWSLATLQGTGKRKDGFIRDMVIPMNNPYYVAYTVRDAVRFDYTDTGDQRDTQWHSLRGKEDIDEIAVSADGRRMIVAKDRARTVFDPQSLQNERKDVRLAVWDVSAPEFRVLNPELFVDKHRLSGLDMAMSTTGDYMFITNGFGIDQLDSPSADDQIGTYQDPAYFATAVASAGDYIASGHSGGRVHIWNFRSGKYVRSLRAPGEGQRSVGGIAFSKDGRYVAASVNNTAYVWERSTGELLSTLSGHTGFIRKAIAFSPSGHIVTGSVDGVVRFWRKKDVENPINSAQTALDESKRKLDSATLIDGLKIDKSRMKQQTYKGNIIEDSFSYDGDNNFILLDQFRSTCGTTSAEMVLHYYGKDVGQGDIWGENGLLNWSIDDILGGGAVHNVEVGTFPSEIEQALNRLEVPADWYNRGTLDHLKQYVRENRPPIILLRFAEVLHYVVVVGYNDAGDFLIADPNNVFRWLTSDEMRLGWSLEKPGLPKRFKVTNGFKKFGLEMAALLVNVLTGGEHFIVPQRPPTRHFRANWSELRAIEVTGGHDWNPGWETAPWERELKFKNDFADYRLSTTTPSSVSNVWNIGVDSAWVTKDEQIAPNTVKVWGRATYGKWTRGKVWVFVRAYRHNKAAIVPAAPSSVTLNDPPSVLSPETSLLVNYPNPFNPETWIPYQLANPAKVTVSIHAADGKLVRVLELGNMPAGVYQDKDRAVYWDGKNEQGESVASGVYFYTLTAGDFTATRKMLILK